MQSIYRCTACGANFRGTHRTCSLCGTESGDTNRGRCSSCGSQLADSPNQQCTFCGSEDVTRVSRDTG